jgi:hypothetical protein
MMLVVDLIKSKLKTALIILLFLFHYYPSLNGIPLPIALTMGAVENFTFG